MLNAFFVCKITDHIYAKHPRKNMTSPSIIAALKGRSTRFISGPKKLVCLLVRPSGLSSLLCRRCAKLIWSGRSMSSLRPIGPSAASHFMASRSLTRRKRARIEGSLACVDFHLIVTSISEAFGARSTRC